MEKRVVQNSHKRLIHCRFLGVMMVALIGLVFSGLHSANAAKEIQVRARDRVMITALTTCYATAVILLGTQRLRLMEVTLV